MDVSDVVWTNDFAVGVRIIDLAHQELFRMTRRMMYLSNEPSKRRWVAEEGLKFLKRYVVTHFSEEEDYMRSVSYALMEGHVAQHTALKEKLLPALEQKLRAQKFSSESLSEFLRIVQLWLCRHIMVHDKAITRSDGNNAMAAGL